jgi:hypothetical protein
MKERNMIKRALVLALAIFCLSVTAISQTAAAPAPTPVPKPKPEHFAGVLSFPRAVTTATWADVRINHYSSDATAKRLAALFLEGGQDALVDALEKLKPIGKASVSGRVGFFDIKLARSRKTPTGRRVIAVSDRPIGFLEAYNSSRSTDYKLGIVVMDLKMNKKGKEVGEGQLIYAAKVKINKKGQLEIEYLGIDPMPFRNIRRQ